VLKEFDMPCFSISEVDYIARAKRLNYDLIISIGDVFNMEPCYTLTTQLAIPWVAYYGQEGLYYPPFLRTQKINEIINTQLIFESMSGKWTYQDLPHYWEPQPYSKVDLRKYLGIDAGKKIALYIGINNRRKGIDLIVDSLVKSDPNWVAYLHTSLTNEWGVDLDSLRKQLKLEGRLYFWNDLAIAMGVSKMPDSGVQGLYQECDLYYHPHRGEGFGLTIVDALMSGIRCAVADVGGPSKYLPKSVKIDADKLCFVKMMGVQYVMKEINVVQPLEKLYKNAPKTHDFKPFTYEQFKDKLKDLLGQSYKAPLWRSL